MPGMIGGKSERATVLAKGKRHAVLRSDKNHDNDNDDNNDNNLTP